MWGKFVSSLQNVLDFNAATLSGCIDILVVPQEDGSLRSTPFHVRFGKAKLLRSREKLVEIFVNGKPTPLSMKLGAAGEAFFITETINDDDLGSDVYDGSPVLTPLSSPRSTSPAHGRSPGETRTKQENSILAPVAAKLASNIPSIPHLESKASLNCPPSTEDMLSCNSSTFLLPEQLTPIPNGMNPNSTHSNSKAISALSNHLAGLSNPTAADILGTAVGALTAVSEEDDEGDLGVDAYPSTCHESPPQLPALMNDGSIHLNPLINAGQQVASSPILSSIVQNYNLPSSSVNPPAPASITHARVSTNAAVLEPLGWSWGWGRLPKNSPAPLVDESAPANAKETAGDVTASDRLHLQAGDETALELTPHDRVIAASTPIPLVIEATASNNFNTFIVNNHPPNLANGQIPIAGEAAPLVEDHVDRLNIDRSSGADALNEEDAERRQLIDGHLSSSDQGVLPDQNINNLSYFNSAYFSFPQPDCMLFAEGRVRVSLCMKRLLSLRTSAFSVETIFDSPSEAELDIFQSHIIQSADSMTKVPLSAWLPVNDSTTTESFAVQLEGPSSPILPLSIAMPILLSRVAFPSFPRSLEDCMPVDTVASLIARGVPAAPVAAASKKSGWLGGWLGSTPANPTSNNNNNNVATTQPSPSAQSKHAPPPTFPVLQHEAPPPFPAKANASNSSAAQQQTPLSAPVQQALKEPLSPPLSSKQCSENKPSPSKIVASQPSLNQSLAPPLPIFSLDSSSPPPPPPPLGASSPLQPAVPAASPRPPVSRIIRRKTLRPSHEQLMSLGLVEGGNTIEFRVKSLFQGCQSVHAMIFLWRPDTKIVISDIDGTITKSDVLGHLMTMVGRDWSHAGVASLYTSIHNNGFQLLYLSSRAIGQADTTRGYLAGVQQFKHTSSVPALQNGAAGSNSDQIMPTVASNSDVLPIENSNYSINNNNNNNNNIGNVTVTPIASTNNVDGTSNGETAEKTSHANPNHAILPGDTATFLNPSDTSSTFRLPNGPLFLSPDRLVTSFKREVIDRKPYIFKIACLKDIKNLFPSNSSPFYAGFGNRDSDRLSYRRVGIPDSKIFLIDPTGTVVCASNGTYSKTYSDMTSISDSMFPPIRTLPISHYNNILNFSNTVNSNFNNTFNNNNSNSSNHQQQTPVSLVSSTLFNNAPLSSSLSSISQQTNNNNSNTNNNSSVIASSSTAINNINKAPPILKAPLAATIDEAFNDVNFWRMKYVAVPPVSMLRTSSVNSTGNQGADLMSPKNISSTNSISAASPPLNSFLHTDKDANSELQVTISLNNAVTANERFAGSDLEEDEGELLVGIGGSEDSQQSDNDKDMDQLAYDLMEC